MHQSAMLYGQKFFEIYCHGSFPEGFTIVELGSQNINGSLREVSPKNACYIGLDFVEGNGVDIVIEDPYQLSIDDESADVVVASSCFEHSEFFWLVFLEIMRILKPEGIFYLNIPSNGFFHKWPVDCWRFYPDSGHALVNWAKRNGYSPALLESFIGKRSAGKISEGGMWNDFVAVFVKDKEYEVKYPGRIIHLLEDFHNGYSNKQNGAINFNELSPDFLLIEENTREIESLNHTIVEQKRELGSLRSDLQKAKWRIREIECSRSWRITAPYRKIGTMIKSICNSAVCTSFISRLVTASLLLPAAICFYGSPRALLLEVHSSGSGALTKVMANHSVVQKRLESRSDTLRTFVLVCFFLAIRFRGVGSVKQSLTRFLSIIRTEGLRGMRSRMVNMLALNTKTSFQVNRSSPKEFPVLTAEVERRILVADYRIPRSDTSAGERATVGILKNLCSLGYDVVFLPNDMIPSPRYETELRVAGLNIVTRESGFNSSAQYLKKHGCTFGTFYFIRVDVAKKLQSIARQMAPDARIIFHAPDLCFLREMREAIHHNDKAKRAEALHTRSCELAVMSDADHIVLVSPVEEPILRKFLPNAPISVFPALYAPVIQTPPPYNDRKNIFFLGGFGHSPNVSAVQWFADQVWPYIHERLPGVEFHIIGAEAPRAIKALGNQPGIKVVGFVPELMPVLENLRVGVAPLQYGAGIKGKVAVTMGAGIPCVCTNIAVEGMGIKKNIHALLENDPVCFAKAVISLYENEEIWTRLARNGQSLVQNNFSDASNRASLMKVLNQSQALPLSLFQQYCQTTIPTPAPAPAPAPDPETEDGVSVSIIVPVYNKWSLTRACLNSVVQTIMDSGVSYEIILADDGSTDETLQATEFFPGLRVVRTPKNLGFLRNCNNAAKQARGHYILLLNNGTVVLPGWLEGLYQTIKQDSSIGIVGSKLLYPNGLIQEAGASLFRDGTAINIGRGASRFSEIFNLQREIDYASGASILIRKSLWNDVGGFDEQYKSEYCEDSDLGMTARSLGMRVMYEPNSEVIHFEHQSYAEQIPIHVKALQDHNIPILLDKWRSTLNTEHAPRCEWQLAASRAERSVSTAIRERRKNGNLNVLFFSPFPSHPITHGNRSTIFQFCRYFQRLGHTIHFVLLNSDTYSTADLEEMRECWDTFEVLPFANPLTVGGQQVPFDGWYTEGMGEHIRILCSKYDVDIVFCSYVFQSKMLEFVPDYILKVIDTHDKMGNRYEMLRKNGQPLEFFSCTPEDEGAYLRRADIVVARREEEAYYFDSVSGRKTAITVPHIEEPNFLDHPMTDLKNVGILASANRINLAITREFLQAIDNKLTNGYAPFTIHIGGQIKDMIEALPASERMVFNKPWVLIHGFLPNLTQFYTDMDVIVSPVTMGTGINVKTVQAMAFGMPLLSTEWGSKGIETPEPMHHHRCLSDLVDSLLLLKKQPKELIRLAKVSRSRYQIFFNSGMDNFKKICAHPKLHN